MNTDPKLKITDRDTELFWRKVDKSGGLNACWEWQGCSHAGSKNSPNHKLAYGYYKTQAKKMWAAHRLAWTLVNGDIPLGLCVLHRCDNPICCNPSHLWLGTRADNMRDKYEKGREGERGRNQLTKEQIIRVLDESGTISEIARRYGVSYATIYGIKTGRTSTRITGLPKVRRHK